MTFAAWDWRNGQLTRRWTFDSNDGTPASGGRPANSQFRGQGNHQLSVADVNNSGRHSIITGSAVIGPDGRGMHTSRRGHGDALHVAHMIKGNPIPQIFMPYEHEAPGAPGVSVRNANNGSDIFVINNGGNVGRGVAAHLDPEFPGFQFWGASNRLHNISGQEIGNVPNSTNHLIWWSGRLSRELLNGTGSQNTTMGVTRWNIRTNTGDRLFTTAGTSINGTKSNPILTADIFGDWREEIIANRDCTAVRIYTTTMPTTHRLVTLMHDPTYRVAVAWQNSSYNQPPHPGYYIASDMDFPPPALNVAVVGGGTTTPTPTINLTAPANNAWFMPGQSITITATASQSGGGTIARAVIECVPAGGFVHVKE